MTTPVEVMRGLSNRAHPASSLIREEAVDNDNPTYGTNPGPSSIVSRKRPKQNQIRLTGEEVGALVAAYQAGSTLEEVAAEFGIYVRTAAAHLERQGVAQRRHRLTSDEVTEVVHLYEQGWSLSQIGERFGVWPQSIGYRLRRAGVKLRTGRGRSPRA